MTRRSRPAFVLSAFVVSSLAAAAFAAACSSGGDAAIVVDAGPATCPAFPVQVQTWKPPPSAGPFPCDTAALALLGAQLAAPAPATYTQIESALRAISDGGAGSCADCVFTRSQADTWGPIVYVDGGEAFVNYGACHALVSGSEACGRAVQEQIACVDEVCTLAGCPAEGLRSCAQAALQQEQGCGRYDVATACAGQVAPLATACRTALDVVTRVCGAPVTVTVDGGT